MTQRETVLAQIHHRPTDEVPYTLAMEEDVRIRLDQHYGSESWRERLVRYIVSCGAIDRKRRESIGEGLERDAFGSLWRVDLRPYRLQEPGLPVPSFDGYEFPSADTFVNPRLKETAEEAMRDHPDRFTMIRLGWGLWESYWAIRGFENALMDSVAEPNFFGDLLDRLTDLYLAQVAQCADISVDALMFADDWGDQRGVMIGADRWREFLKPRYAQIYEATHSQGKLVISHCCGSVVDIMPDMIEIGLDVLQSVQPEAAGMNPYQLKRRWGDRITFWGCLGSQSTIPLGTPTQIHDEVGRLCREMGKGGGYILAPAKALQPETPTENAAALVEAFTSQE